MIGSSTRTGRFIQGLSLGYVSMAVTLLVGLWLTPFLLRHLGQEDFGVWLMIGQAMTYMALMDLGVVALLPRETAFAVGRAGSIEGASDIPEIVGRAVGLVIWQVPFVACIAVIAWFCFPVQMQNAAGPLSWLLVLFVIRFPLRVFPEVLVGLQDLAVIGQIQLVAFLLMTVTTVVLILYGWGLYALVLGWGVGQFLPAVASVWRLWRRFPSTLPASLPSLPWRSARKLLTQGAWVSLAQIAHLLVYGSDILILGNMLGPAAVVPYACTSKLVNVLQNQPQLIMETARPALSELKAGRNQDRLYEVSAALTLFAMLLGGLVACGIAATNRGFTIWWVGENLFGGVWLTTALIANMLLRLWNATAVNAAFAFGYERRISLTTLADGFTACGLAIILVPWLGMIAVPLASIASVLAVSLPWNLSAMSKEGGVPLSRQVVLLSGWFSRFAILFGVVLWTEHYLALRTFFAIAVAAGVVTLVYGLLMLPLGRKPPLVDYLHPVMAGVKARFRRTRTGSAGTPD